jgi:hypothetical protein
MDLISHLKRTNFDFTDVLLRDESYATFMSSLLSLQEDITHTRKYCKQVLSNSIYSTLSNNTCKENLRRAIIRELSDEGATKDDATAIKDDATAIKDNATAIKDDATAIKDNANVKEQSRKLGFLNTLFAGPTVPQKQADLVPGYLYPSYRRCVSKHRMSLKPPCNTYGNTVKTKCLSKRSELHAKFDQEWNQALQEMDGDTKFKPKSDESTATLPIEDSDVSNLSDHHPQSSPPSPSTQVRSSLEHIEPRQTSNPSEKHNVHNGLENLVTLSSPRSPMPDTPIRDKLLKQPQPGVHILPQNASPLDSDGNNTPSLCLPTNDTSPPKGNCSLGQTALNNTREHMLLPTSTVSAQHNSSNDGPQPAINRPNLLAQPVLASNTRLSTIRQPKNPTPLPSLDISSNNAIEDDARSDRGLKRVEAPSHIQNGMEFQGAQTHPQLPSPAQTLSGVHTQGKRNAAFEGGTQGSETTGKRPRYRSSNRELGRVPQVPIAPAPPSSDLSKHPQAQLAHLSSEQPQSSLSSQPFPLPGGGAQDKHRGLQHGVCYGGGAHGGDGSSRQGKLYEEGIGTSQMRPFVTIHSQQGNGFELGNLRQAQYRNQASQSNPLYQNPGAQYLPQPFEQLAEDRQLSYHLPTSPPAPNGAVQSSAIGDVEWNTLMSVFSAEEEERRLFSIFN